ncbi:hypothetical protein GBA52_000293 [Prunus armeniaca]|nr:hypothetical protein GBA52_000293 [Prunus armeniaca]
MSHEAWPESKTWEALDEIQIGRMAWRLGREMQRTRTVGPHFVLEVHFVKANGSKTTQLQFRKLDSSARLGCRYHELSF